MAEDRPPDYRFRWERALRGSGLHPTTRLVLLALGTYMDPDGTNARPTQQTLAVAAGLSVRAVRDHLAKAVELGWLERTKRGGKRGSGAGAIGLASVYAACVPSRSEPEAGAGSDSSQPEPAAGWERNGISEPADHASEPADHDLRTGTPVPTTTQDHVDHCSSRAEVPEHIKVQARREIRAKRDRGEAIHNESGLFRDICRQLVEAERLDAELDGQDHDDVDAAWQARLESQRSLGRNRALVPDLTEADLRRELADVLNEDLVAAAIAGFEECKLEQELAGR